MAANVAGLYISLLETKRELIVILDTEGLLSVEARDDVFDKQARTTGIAIPAVLKDVFLVSSWTLSPDGLDGHFPLEIGGFVPVPARIPGGNIFGLCLLSPKRSWAIAVTR